MPEVSRVSGLDVDLAESGLDTGHDGYRPAGSVRTFYAVDDEVGFRPVLVCR